MDKKKNRGAVQKKYGPRAAQKTPLGRIHMSSSYGFPVNLACARVQIAPKLGENAAVIGLSPTMIAWLNLRPGYKVRVALGTKSKSAPVVASASADVDADASTSTSTSASGSGSISSPSSPPSSSSNAAEVSMIVCAMPDLLCTFECTLSHAASAALAKCAVLDDGARDGAHPNMPTAPLWVHILGVDVSAEMVQDIAAAHRDLQTAIARSQFAASAKVSPVPWLIVMVLTWHLHSLDGFRLSVSLAAAAYAILCLVWAWVRENVWQRLAYLKRIRCRLEEVYDACIEEDVNYEEVLTSMTLQERANECAMLSAMRGVVAQSMVDRVVLMLILF